MVLNKPPISLFVSQQWCFWEMWRIQRTSSRNVSPDLKVANSRCRAVVSTRQSGSTGPGADGITAAELTGSCRLFQVILSSNVYERNSTDQRPTFPVLWQQWVSTKLSVAIQNHCDVGIRLSWSMFLVKQTAKNLFAWAQALLNLLLSYASCVTSSYHKAMWTCQ